MRKTMVSATLVVVAVLSGIFVARGETDAVLLVILAVAGVVIAGVVPFRVLVGGLVLIAVVTRFRIPLGEGSLRYDFAFLPVVILAGVVQNKLRQATHWMTRAPLLFLAAWVALQVVSSISYAEKVGASLFVAAWYAADLVIVVLTLCAFGDRRSTLVRLLVASAVISALTGLGGWLIATVTGTPNWAAGISPQVGVRANGLAIEPNVLASWTACAVLLLITAGRLNRASRWALVPLAIVLPLATTRGALVALVLGLAVFTVSRPRVIQRLAPLGLLMAGMGAVFTAADPDRARAIFEKLLELQFSDYNSTYRFISWKLAWEDIWSGPWLTGLGTNSFQQRHISPTRQIGGDEEFYLSALPLQILHDSGLVGVVFVGAAAVALLRNRTSSRRMAFMVFFLAASTATSPWYFASWWLLIGVALASNGERSSVTDHVAPPVRGLQGEPARFASKV